MTVDYKDVLEAQARISGLVHRTPVLTSEKLDAIAGTQLFFKCENLQKVGAFKARGGANAVFALDDAAAAKGVATHSSGNHGAALARAAALRNIPAYIVIPSNAKQVKQDAIRDYGAEVILCEPTLAAREAKLAEVIERTRAVEIHPYDDANIIAGQGTTALEIIEQVEDLDVIVTPVGGGGLLAGCSLVAEHSGFKIYGAEPEGADDAYRSFQSGELVTSHVPDTICDGLLTTVGRQNFEIIKRSVEEILLVSDQETITALELLWTRLKLVVEPSSAVTLAAVLKYPDRFAGKKVALVLTGGNVDLKDLPFSRSQ